MRRSESDVAETAPWRSFRRSCRSRFILPSLSAGEEATVVGLVSQANPAQPRIRFWHCHIIQVPEYRSSPSSSTNETRRHVTRGFHELPNDEALARVNLAPPPPSCPRIWGEQGQAGKDGVLQDMQPTRKTSGACPTEEWEGGGGIRCGAQDKTRQGPGAEASGVDWAWEPAVASSGWPAAALTHRPLHANHGAAFPPPLCHGSSHALFLSVDLRGSSGPRASVEGQASEAVIRRPLRFPRYREAIWSVNAAVAEQRSASPSKMIGNKTTQ